MALIHAIETRYAGRLFRSRLEARWAVFYDAIGIPWVYEPEGFQLIDGDGQLVHYLPDFFLPQQDCYIEIKPTEPTDHEGNKAALLAQLTQKQVFIFIGQPGYHQDSGYPSGQIVSDGAYLYDSLGWDNYYAWCVCLNCDLYGIEFDGRSERLPCGCNDPNGPDNGSTFADARLIDAYDCANQARFLQS